MELLRELSYCTELATGEVFTHKQITMVDRLAYFRIIITNFKVGPQKDSGRCLNHSS